VVIIKQAAATLDDTSRSPFQRSHNRSSPGSDEGGVTTALTLDVATSTIHRWLNDGIIAGEQLTPGAPWRIRLTDDLHARVGEEAPDDYLTMYQTMRLLGVPRV
jgi:hypothetical protein